MYAAIVNAAFERYLNEWIDANPANDVGRASQQKMIARITGAREVAIETVVAMMMNIAPRRDDIFEVAFGIERDQIDYALLSESDQAEFAYLMIMAAVESPRRAESAELQAWTSYSAHRVATSGEEERWLLS